MQKPFITIMAILAAFAAAGSAWAQATPAAPPSVFGGVTIGPLGIGGQANFVLQGHDDFRSPYEGTNSLRAQGERALSRVLTLYTTCRLSRDSELVVDVESSGGKGISNALGVAGFSK